MNTKKLNDLPQREKKYAKTKITLLNTLLNELETKKLVDIKIKDLAFLSEISEPTFFNYFDCKIHMLVYFIQMWSIDMNSIALKSENIYINNNIEIIKDIFKKTSEQISEHPQIMLEIISFQAQGIELTPHIITDAEKWLFFPDIKDVENLKSMGLESIIPPLLENAKLKKEISIEVDTQMLFLNISSLFFGLALLLLKDSAEAYPSILEKQINQLFKGLS